MIFACRTPHTPAPLFSRTDGLDMKVSTRQKQGATRHKRAGAIGDNSASCVPRRGQASRSAPVQVPTRTSSRHVGAVRNRPLTSQRAFARFTLDGTKRNPGLQYSVGALLAAPQLATMSHCRLFVVEFVAVAFDSPVLAARPVAPAVPGNAILLNGVFLSFSSTPFRRCS